MENVRRNFAGSGIEDHYHFSARLQLQCDILNQEWRQLSTECWKEVDGFERFACLLMCARNCINKQSPGPAHETDKALVRGKQAARLPDCFALKKQGGESFVNLTQFV